MVKFKQHLVDISSHVNYILIFASYGDLTFVVSVYIVFGLHIGFNYIKDWYIYTLILYALLQVNNTNWCWLPLNKFFTLKFIVRWPFLVPIANDIFIDEIILLYLVSLAFA